MNAFIFPVTALLCAALGYALPGVFAPLKTLIVPLLITIMLGMGMTLTLRDFTDIFNKKRALALGVALQFIVMPLAGLGVSRLLNLNDELTAGMMLVGTSAGGTASNVITYLARGNVALSVSMTLCSTLLSIVLMPLLTWLYIGQKVPVPATDMLIDLVKITLVPLTVGVSLNTFAHRVVARAQLLREVMYAAVDVAVVVAVAVVHCLYYRQRFLRAGGVVEVGQRFAVDGAAEDGEFVLHAAASSSPSQMSLMVWWTASARVWCSTTTASCRKLRMSILRAAS